MGARAAGAVTGGQRIAGAIALLSGAATVLPAKTVAIVRFPSGLLLRRGRAGGVVVRGGAGRGGTHLGISVAVLALAGRLDPVVPQRWMALPGVARGRDRHLWHAAARAAFQVHVRLPAAEPPRRTGAVLNPWSGGGKAAKSACPGGPARGIRTVELRRGRSRAARPRRGAAGPTRSRRRAGTAPRPSSPRAAAAHGLPYACIPAGTRNHFALDLGVDRDDVVGALDAFVDGGERLVDLGEVNGRVFVNNVSLGVLRRGGAEQATATRSSGPCSTPYPTSSAPRCDSTSSGCPPTARPTRCGDDPGVRRQARGGCRPGQSGRRRAAQSACSGNGRRWTDTGRGQMAKFGKRMTKFAKSPKGQKLLDKAMRKAKDPKTRAKLKKKFGRKK